MGKAIRCSDIYLGCDFIFRGANDDEVIALALNHAQRKHGLAEIDWEALAKFSKAVREDRKKTSGTSS